MCSTVLRTGRWFKRMEFLGGDGKSRSNPNGKDVFLGGSCDVCPVMCVMSDVGEVYDPDHATPPPGVPTWLFPFSVRPCCVLCVRVVVCARCAYVSIRVYTCVFGSDAQHFVLQPSSGHVDTRPGIPKSVKSLRQGSPRR